MPRAIAEQAPRSRIPLHLLKHRASIVHYVPRMHVPRPARDGMGRAQCVSMYSQTSRKSGTSPFMGATGFVTTQPWAVCASG